MEKKIPKIKADDFVDYDDGEGPTNFTYFQELQKQVEVLIDQVNEIKEILDFNNLTRMEVIKPSGFDWDKVYKELDEENK